MKVSELISILKDYDPDLPVVVSGYEDGFEEFSIRILPLEYVPEAPYYSGEFQEAHDSASALEMLCIIRNMR